MDELLHKTGTKHILQLLIGHRENDPVFQQIWKNHQDEFRAMFMDAVKEESDWADYLFSGGSMIGLNADILKSFLLYTAHESITNLGMVCPFDAPRSNPLPWMRGWLSSESVQVAPQETEITSYLTGQIDSDIDDMSADDWDDD